MVHRMPLQNKNQPSTLSDQFTLSAALPPMRSIKNQAFKDGIRAKYTQIMVDQVERLIQAENMTAQVRVDNSAPKSGYALLICGDDAFRAKVAALPAVRAVAPVTLSYPMGAPKP